MTSVEAALRRVADLGRREEIAWALIGGLAVSVRTEPRFTRDVDLAVAAQGDGEAEQVAGALVSLGYQIETVVEQTATARMATVRLRWAGGAEEPYVDLLFASSEIEPEIVEGAEILAVLPGLQLPVASPADLLATKLLAADATRPQDQVDAVALRAVLDEPGVERTRHALRLIEERGFNRGLDLQMRLDALEPTDD